MTASTADFAFATASFSAACLALVDDAPPHPDRTIRHAATRTPIPTSRTHALSSVGLRPASGPVPATSSAQRPEAQGHSRTLAQLTTLSLVASHALSREPRRSRRRASRLRLLHRVRVPGNCSRSGSLITVGVGAHAYVSRSLCCPGRPRCRSQRSRHGGVALRGQRSSRYPSSGGFSKPIGFHSVSKSAFSR